METPENKCNFNEMELPASIVDVLGGLGWEQPTPIQSATIPAMLAGRDVVGQAQTGTGKTAAFALPILARIDLARHEPQVLILTPTRELCIQVAEAFEQFGGGMKALRVLPVYGGQGFNEQLYALKRGVHIIVGTPGRVMDHMRRETLKLDKLAFLVLDEADEMLQMGFIEDIEWILEQTPSERQIALFSATMPPEIRRIALKHLKEPQEITIRNATTTAENIRHRYWVTPNPGKFEVLTRILETEEHDGVLIFARTKSGTIDLAEGLTAWGIPAAALNGDMKQVERERTVNRFKEGKMDILVATDVAARGLDVDRISHVINYDPPHDTEGYVHRVGRTGRAGRSGEAIIIATPRERRFLADIERATRQKLEHYEMPTLEGLNRKRTEKFKTRLTEALANDGCATFARIIGEYQEETGVPAVNIAAALARLIQGSTPLLLDRMPEAASAARTTTSRDRTGRTDRGERSDRPSSMDRDDRPVIRPPRPDRAPGDGMDRYRIECGHAHGVMPGNIVGAIANEAGLRGSDIGHIDIFEEYSTVDLPTGMPDDIYAILKKTRVANRCLALSLIHQGRQDSYDRPERRERHERHEKPGSSGGDDRPARAAADARPRRSTADARPRRATVTRSSDRPAPSSPRTRHRRDS